jgi:hypothetical protein
MAAALVVNSLAQVRAGTVRTIRPFSMALEGREWDFGGRLCNHRRGPAAMEGSTGVYGGRVMLRVFPSARRTFAAAIVHLALLGGCIVGLAPGLSDASAQEAPALRTSISVKSEPDRSAQQCLPPKSLCGGAIKELEQGGFLDFRVGATPGPAAIRLLSPFAVVSIEPLDKTRCPGKLCAAHVALAALGEELLRQGYYTRSVTLDPRSAVLTLRTERIDRTMKVLKGGCRFNLDVACGDSDAWLQEDKKTGEQCGFAQTRVFVAAAMAPEFVGVASFTTQAAMPAAEGPEALRSVALDPASVKVYELMYVHKICRGEMVLVRNG